MGYSDWKLAVNLKLKFLKLSAYFHMRRPKATSATGMNCGGFICLTVLLDKLNELTVEQDASTLSHKSHLSEVTRLIHLKDVKVLFKNHIYQVLLGIFCFLVTYHCRLAPWSHLTINKTVGMSSEKKAQDPVLEPR